MLSSMTLKGSFSPYFKTAILAFPQSESTFIFSRFYHWKSFKLLVNFRSVGNFEIYLF